MNNIKATYPTPIQNKFNLSGKNTTVDTKNHARRSFMLVEVTQDFAEKRFICFEPQHAFT
jgi:hypothetical protein